MNWKKVETANRYSVSDMGLVRDDLKDRLLHQSNLTGYRTVSIINNDGKRLNQFVHRLVGKAFLLNPENLATINHKDGCKSNNNVGNLEWCSRNNNTKHAWTDLGLAKRVCRPRRGRSVRGVYRNSLGKKPFRAAIKRDGKYRTLGYYSNESDARKAYCSAHYELLGEVPREYLNSDLQKLQTNPLIGARDIINARRSIRRNFSDYSQEKQDFLLAATLQAIVQRRQS